MTHTDHIDPDGLLRETRWLHALAGGLVHDEHAAEDVVQSTFLQALTHPPHDAGALRTWLAQVARRFGYRAGDRARWIRRWEADAARPEAQPSAADLVGRADVHRQLVQAVLALEEPNRSTILLRYFEDLPPREIAKRQGVPVATVRSRVRRALEQLRERLDRAAGGREAWLSLLGIPAAPIAAAGAAAGAVVTVATKTKLALAAAVVLLIAGGLTWKAMQSSGGGKDEARGGPARRGGSEVAQIQSGERPGPAARTPASGSIRPRRLDEVANASGEHRVFGVVVDADSGDPLANAEVTVARTEEGAEPVRMVTKDDGRFTLPMPGSYWDPRVDRLRIAAPDHVPWVSDDPWSGDRSQSRPGGRDVDFGAILVEQGAIVSGRIVTADGRPVAAAALFLKRGGLALEPTSGMLPVGVSREDGTFTLPDRVASNVLKGSIREAWLIALHKDGVDWAYLNVVKGVDRVPVEILARGGFAARVEVVDGNRRPQKGAVVLAFPRFQPLGIARLHRAPPKPADPVPGSRTGALAQRLVGKTDAAGVASFKGLPEGRVDSTFDPLAENAIEFFAYQDGFEPGSVKVAAPFAPNAVTIVLTARRERAILGSVKDGKGSGVAGASVTLQGGTAVATTTGSGEYRVSLEGAGEPGEWVVVAATAAGLASEARSIRIAPGQPDPRVDFVLQPAVPVTGRVVDEAGKPVAGVRVIVRRDSSAGSYLAAENDGVTRDDGRFSFPLADAGQWELIAQAAFINEDESEFEPSRGRAVFGGQPVEVVLRRRAVGNAKVVAEIVDESTGEALDPLGAAILPANATAGDYYDRGSMLAVSRGRASGEKITPGSWRLMVAATGYARYEQPFTVGPDDREIRLRAALARPGVVIAKVVLDDLPADRRPAQVTVWTPDCRWVTEPGKPAPDASRGSGIASESNQWTCRFEDVTPGAPLRFWLTSEDGTTAEQLLKIRSGETKTIELRPRASGKARFSTAGKLTGAVRLQAGDESGAWHGIAEKILDPAAVWTHEVERPAGAFRWRVQVLSLDMPARLRQPKFVEGEAKIEAGKITVIEVRVPE